jgi:hypothetical protein
MLTDELLTYLFDGKSHLLAEEMRRWLSSSRRFTTFATSFRDKIRKKLRVTQDPESLLDLRLELETAYLLLQERSLNLVYEPQLAERVRAPDFSVTFTTSFTFMVEVTRLRADHKSRQAETTEQRPTILSAPDSPTTALIDERLVDTICSKLGQLLPQRSNVLLVGVEALPLTQADLRATMLNIQQRAERSEITLLQRGRFRDRAEFFNYFQRLSEIIVRGPGLQPGERMVAWANPQAKHPLPAKARTALYRSQAA